MAYQFGNSLKNLKFIRNGKALLERNKLLPRSNVENKSTDVRQGIHLSAKQQYPLAEPLPLPLNIDPAESARFSPQRARDITSTAISTNIWNRIDITVDTSTMIANSDPHVDSYDCTGAVSLNSSMQSNVPSPFGGMHKFTHLNMPGGQWEQSSKWMSHDLHSSHYTTLRREARKNWSNPNGGSRSACSDGSKMQSPPSNRGSVKYFEQNLHGVTSSRSNAFQMCSSINRFAPGSAACTNPLFTFSECSRYFIAKRMYSDQSAIKTKACEAQKTETDVNTPQKQSVLLSKREQLKKAIKDYGITVPLFHISMSLVSLGLFYQLVASGLDMVAILEYIGLGSDSTVQRSVAAGGSTFVVAYAVHKVFAPVRISITLVAAPFIVKFLRKRGILKPKGS